MNPPPPPSSSDSSSAARFAGQPGSGRVARFGDAVLFCPQAGPAADDLAAALEAGVRSASVVETVGRAVLSAGADAPDFACAVLDGMGITILVRGAMLGSAHDAAGTLLPLDLDAASARTWHETDLDALPGTIITLGPSAGGVDLALGVSNAGAVTMTIGGEPNPPESASSGPATDDGMSQLAHSDPIDLGLSSADPGDPAASAAAIAAAGVDEAGEPVLGRDDEQPEPPSPPPPPHSTQAPPPPSSTPAPPAPAPAATPAEGAVMVEAKACGLGHANAPMATDCRVCGAFLPPETSVLELMARPSLGVLEFDDGSTHELDAELLFGRNAGADDTPSRADLRPVDTPGEEVSRVHLEVRLKGWDVEILDCNSTNGTVVRLGDGPPVDVTAGVPMRIEPGTTVYFGSRSFQYR